ncbi:MAG: hypothetical protein KDH15_19515 [Rhodocyclaceae bacterium]|nr:hypothetical protein [Rhodocyclaceae bacterium]
MELEFTNDLPARLPCAMPGRDSSRPHCAPARFVEFVAPDPAQAVVGQRDPVQI